MPYNGEFHFTALRTSGTLRAMSASRRFPTSRFQPGIPAMYACTGASPSAFAIRGLPPERRTAACSPFRTELGLALLAPGLAFAPAFGASLDLVADFARDVPLLFGFALPDMRTESGSAFMRIPAPRRRSRSRVSSESSPGLVTLADPVPSVN